MLQDIMTDVVEFRSTITREEMARLIYFLIYSNPNRWLFFLLAAVSAGCLTDMLIGLQLPQRGID